MPQAGDSPQAISRPKTIRVYPWLKTSDSSSTPPAPPFSGPPLLPDWATAEQILADYPDLEAEDIRACLAYASRYLDHSVLVATW